MKKYQLKVVILAKVSQYYVINKETGMLHSKWPSFVVARKVTEDLNKMERIAA